MKNHKQFKYVAYLNKAFPFKEDLLDLASYLESLGFVYAEVGPVQPGEGKAYSLGEYTTAIALLERMYRESEPPDESLPLVDQNGPVAARLQAYLPVYTTAPLPDQPVKAFGQNPRFYAAFDMRGSKYNEIQFILGRYDHEVDLKWKLSDLLLKIAREFYRRFRPAYAWFYITPPDVERLFLEPILEYQLRELYWANFFGPEYVAKYGKDFFLDAPVWKTEELTDGGMLVQLSPNLMDTSIDLDLQELSQYFYPVGVRVLAWPKLVLFTDPGQVEKPFEDMDF